MVQMVNNGMSLQGDADFNGKPFSVAIFSSWAVAKVLEDILNAQTQANYANTSAVSTYNSAVHQANTSNGGVPPPATVPKMKMVPDYPSDATALNPTGTGTGQPITEEKDFPEGTLLAVAPAPKPAPAGSGGGFVTLAGEPPAWAVMLWNQLGTVAADVAAIKKHYGA